MSIETNGEQLGVAGSLIVLYVTVLLTLLVFIPIVFPESWPKKSKAQFLGYVAVAVLWPVICIGWACRVVQLFVFWFWSLPIVEQEPKP